MRSKDVSVTLACFVSTSKPVTSKQLPKALPPKDLTAVSGYSIWPTTLTSYTKVNARGIISSFSTSQGTSSPTDPLHLTATSSS